MTGRYKARSLFTSRHHCSCPSLGEQSDQLGVSPGFLGCLLWGFVWPKRKIRFFFDYWSVVCPRKACEKVGVRFLRVAANVLHPGKRSIQPAPTNTGETPQQFLFD